MSQEKNNRPTEAEYRILDLLWQQGPATVAELHQKLSDERTTAYTTVLKFLQIMLAKGLVTRDTSQRAHVYAATTSKAETQTSLLNHWMGTVFGGSPGKLVMRALSSKKASKKELAQIRAYLDSLEDEDA